MAHSTKTFIDLTDFVTNTLWHGVCTGIQRVQLNVALDMALYHQAISFSLFEGEWLDLTPSLLSSQGDPEHFMELIRSQYQATVKYRAKYSGRLIAGKVYRVWRRVKRIFWDRRMFLLSRKRIKAGDALVVLGCFWQLPSLVDIYADLANGGVIIVGLCHDVFPIFVSGKPARHSIAYQMRRFLALPMTIIANSDYTKSEICRASSLGLIKSLSREPLVVPLAHEFLGQHRNAKLERPGRLSRHIGSASFVLIVGGHEPRKNHLFAIESWKRIYLEIGTDLPFLVFAGKIRGGIDRIYQHARIKWLDCPTDEELAALYSSCEFTIYPSLAEGWGLPVGESLWFGKTCAASKRPSIPEVGKNLCHYFDPTIMSEFELVVKQLLEPEIRMIAEDKIRNSPLRSWRSVYKDLAGVISASISI